MGSVVPFERSKSNNNLDIMLGLLVAIRVVPSNVFLAYHDFERPYFRISSLSGRWQSEEAKEHSISYVLGSVPRSKYDSIVNVIKKGEADTGNIIAWRVVEERGEIMWEDDLDYQTVSCNRVVCSNGEKVFFDNNIEHDNNVKSIIQRDIFSFEYIYPSIKNNKVKGLVAE